MLNQSALISRNSSGLDSMSSGRCSSKGLASGAKLLNEIQVISSAGIPALSHSGALLCFFPRSISISRPSTAIPVAIISARLAGALYPLRLKAARVRGSPRLNRASGNSEAVKALLAELIGKCVTWICAGLEDPGKKKFLADGKSQYQPI